MTTAGAKPWGLVERGINYDAGTEFIPGQTSREVWREDLVRQELGVIADELHCTSVNVYGTDIGRLTEVSALALERGLRVSMQPRLVEGNERDTLEHLAAAARAAERLRREYGRIRLVLGCELTLFMSGILPGRTFVERSRSLGLLWWFTPWLQGRLNRTLRKANAVAKANFNGQTTYGAGFWEQVDWRGFDVVGLNYYRYSGNQASYVRDLRAFHGYGKPIVILEFGCCAYEGADEEGPTVDEKIDWSTPTPEFTVDRVRNEQLQADHIAHLLDIYETEQVHGAFVFEYVTPSYPHSPDPRHDLDMASFNVVKVHPEDAEKPYSSGYWEPRAAFHTIASHYGRPLRRRL